MDMNNMTLKARAKVNLALDVLGKRADGYHEVKMIMQQIDLFDEIQLEEIPYRGIYIETNLDYLPNNEDNIAYKAADLMIKQYNIEKGIYIRINKNIPVSAGLAGGSTDAAAVILGLNALWDLNIDKTELLKLGVKIGADVPFCLIGGCALAEGIGEKLTPITGLDCFVVLCKPNIRVSTADVYKKLKLEKLKSHPDIDSMIHHIKEDQFDKIRKNMVNVLETVTISEYPIIYSIKKKMLECQAEASLMSGSGPTVFGIFKDYERAKSAYENLKRLYNETFLVKSVR